MMRRQKQRPRTARLKIGRWVLLAAVLVVALIWGAHQLTSPKTPTLKLSSSVNQPPPKAATQPTTQTKSLATSTTAPASQPKASTQPKHIKSCSDNTELSQNIIVSISQRHLWACSHTSVAYNSAVITGMEYLAADLTPTGTYHIYAKYTDTTLSGRDSTGSWNDPVSYWMPWLHNGYGTYGFHDATWRKDSDFGNISPYSKDKSALPSHGCVELPLATAKWLYNWSAIGTTVTIVS